MTALGLLRDDLARAFDGDAWHGDPLAALLDGLAAGPAAAHPVAGAHSVWEIVLHVSAWMDVGAARIAARAALPATADWPPVPVPADAAAWAAALARLGAAHRALLGAVDAVAETELWAPLGTRDRAQGTGGTIATLVSGLAQHAAYHGGQIALLRRALDA